eukprot:619634_1
MPVIRQKTLLQFFAFVVSLNDVLFSSILLFLHYEDGTLFDDWLEAAVLVVLLICGIIGQFGALMGHIFAARIFVNASLFAIIAWLFPFFDVLLEDLTEHQVVHGKALCSVITDYIPKSWELTEYDCLILGFLLESMFKLTWKFCSLFVFVRLLNYLKRHPTRTARKSPRKVTQPALISTEPLLMGFPVVVPYIQPGSSSRVFENTGPNAEESNAAQTTQNTTAPGASHATQNTTQSGVSPGSVAYFVRSIWWQWAWPIVSGPAALPNPDLEVEELPEKTFIVVRNRSTSRWFGCLPIQIGVIFMAFAFDLWNPTTGDLVSYGAGLSSSLERDLMSPISCYHFVISFMAIWAITGVLFGSRSMMSVYFLWAIAHIVISAFVTMLIDTDFEGFAKDVCEDLWDNNLYGMSLFDQGLFDVNMLLPDVGLYRQDMDRIFGGKEQFASSCVHQYKIGRAVINIIVMIYQANVVKNYLISLMQRDLLTISVGRQVRYAFSKNARWNGVVKAMQPGETRLARVFPARKSWWSRSRQPDESTLQYVQRFDYKSRRKPLNREALYILAFSAILVIAVLSGILWSLHSLGVADFTKLFDLDSLFPPTNSTQAAA